MSQTKRRADIGLVPYASRLRHRAARVVNREYIKRTIIVMGASAGGIEVLTRLFSEMPPDLAAIVGVVLHRGPLPSQLLEILSKKSALPIMEPSRDLKLEKGRIVVAPPDHHPEFTPHHLVIRRGPKEHSTRPAIDPLFRSVAQSFGNRVVGVLLSGGGDDGVNGLIMIKEHGGISLAQEPQDSEMPYMPRNAIRYDHVDGVLPVQWNRADVGLTGERRRSRMLNRPSQRFRTSRAPDVLGLVPVRSTPYNTPLSDGIVDRLNAAHHALRPACRRKRQRLPGALTRNVQAYRISLVAPRKTESTNRSGRDSSSAWEDPPDRWKHSSSSSPICRPTAAAPSS
jgi:two-component system chemotaxis response regulator CheB